MPAAQSVSRGKFDFGSLGGVKQMTRYPAGEHLTVPRHVDTSAVETMLSADSLAPGTLAKMTPLVVRPAALAMRTPLKDLTGRIVNRLPEGADSPVKGSRSEPQPADAIVVANSSAAKSRERMMLALAGAPRRNHGERDAGGDCLECRSRLRNARDVGRHEMREHVGDRTDECVQHGSGREGGFEVVRVEDRVQS